MSFISLLIAAVDFSLGPLCPMKVCMHCIIPPEGACKVVMCVVGLRCRKVKFKMLMIKTAHLTPIMRKTRQSNKQQLGLAALKNLTIQFWFFRSQFHSIPICQL